MCGVSQNKIEDDKISKAMAIENEAIANQEKNKQIQIENEKKKYENKQLEEKERAKKLIDLEIERQKQEKEDVLKRATQLEQEKEELERKLKQKEIEENKKEQERNEEIEKISEAHQNELLEQKRAADLQEIERQEQVKKLELEHEETKKEKEVASKRAALEKEAAAAEIKKIGEEKARLENDKLEYVKRFEASQAKIRTTRNVAIIIFLILIAAGFIFYKFFYSTSNQNSVNAPTTSNVKAKEATAVKPAKPETSSAAETSAPIVKEDNSFAPSFNCAKASTQVERLICGDREIASLDVQLNQLYTKAMDSGKDSEGLKASQIEWRESARDKCEDKECLVIAYKNRNSVLSN
jgi:hypothetical protein